MTWLRARVLLFTGVLCLAGQGTLLLLAGAGPGTPRLPLPAVFLGLTILQILIQLRDWRLAKAGDPATAPGPALRIPALAASLVMVGVGLGFLSVRGSNSLPAVFRPDPAEDLAEVRESLEALVPALDELGAGLPAMFRETEAAAGGMASPGGDPFRITGGLSARWEEIFSGSPNFPLEAVLWDENSRVAWTGGAEPLPPWDISAPRDTSGAGRRSLVESRDRWFLREVGRAPGGFGLEFQVPLTSRPVSGIPSGVAVEVLGTEAAEPGDDPVGATEIVEVLPGRSVRLTALDDGLSGGAVRWRSRLLLSGLLAWVVALALGTRLLGGPMALLAALWVGRAMLASSEFLRWVTQSFPGQVFPAHPGSLFSLVDPAYFATPFAFGWFASVADALLTAMLISATAWRLLVFLGVAEGSGFARLRSPWRRQGVMQGLFFGPVAGLVLLWLRFFAGLLAENANARLIGTGVSLPFLSFWGLHVALMLMAFGLAALATGLLARPDWPRRDELARWLGGAAAAAGGAAAVNLFLGEGWGKDLVLAAAVAATLWVLAPALLARPHFLRRFAWPAILLVTVVWNYGSLRAVYDQAELSWLERKGAVITQADPEWTRILLGSVLEEMAAQEAGSGMSPVSRTDVWRDEAAWSLWTESALRDLGYSCLVEIVDEESGQESLFAQGFLRDYQYEVVERSPWVGLEGLPVQTDWDMIFQTERRIYAGGQEEVVAAEIARSGGQGWIRVELPVRSWRISTLLRDLGGGQDPGSNGYRPRAEVDRPVLLLRADDSGWLETDAEGFPGPEASPAVAALRAGRVALAQIPRGGRSWLCMWNPLPAGAARTPGEGFLLGLQRSNFREDLLDLSRLMLLNLVLLFTLFGVIQVYRWLTRDRRASGETPWRPGFQERFLAGYLLLGMVLLLVVGASVDKVGYDRVRREARTQTRAGLSLAVEQLRNLLVEQARSLAASEYIADLLEGQLAGTRPAGPMDVRQGMVYGPDGTLLLDETLSDLDPAQATELLNAGRQSPLVVVQDGGELYVGTVIPLDLEGFIAEPAAADDLGHSGNGSQGFFFYRQVLDADLVASLADLVDGQAMLRFDGLPVFASQSAVVFSGEAPLLAEPFTMAALMDHPSGMGVFAAPGRPFAFTGAQPLPAFARDSQGKIRPRRLPAILALNFPDREREYIAQRRGTVLFLTGMANLILLTALVLALLMSWNIFRPLRLLLTATRSLAQGDFGAPLPDPGSDEIGRLAGAFGLMRSDLQTARDDLAARERFLATVLDRVTVGVAVLDRDGNVVTLNPAGRQILEEFLPAVEDDEGVTWLLAHFRKIAAGRERVSGEMVSEDGRRTLRGAMAPLDLPGGRRDTMLVFEDITEFLDNKKMAINAELARQVAHEIKNPLTPIQLSVQLLGQAWQDKHPDLDRIVDETVSRVLDQVTLLRSIAGEFSLLGRPGELETEAVDLEALVKEVLAGYGAGKGAGTTDDQMVAAAGIPVPVVDLEPCPAPAVMAHRESLQKILGNLMQNSLDAARPEQRLSIRISWRREGDRLTLIWADNGAGLPPEVADRLFDPYFSTKSKGTGLGLAICRNLADRMGGTIRLFNRDDGSGAIAELSLRIGSGNGSRERSPEIP